MDGANFDPRATTWTNLLHNKFKSSSLNTFGEEGFSIFYLFLEYVSKYAMDWNHLTYSWKGTGHDHFGQVSSNLALWFQRKWLKYGRQTDAGSFANGNSLPELSLRWAKKNKVDFTLAKFNNLTLIVKVI